MDGGSCWQSDLWLNTEDGKGLGVWSTLAMEEGIFWYVGERVRVGKRDEFDLILGSYK